MLNGEFNVTLIFLRRLYKHNINLKTINVMKKVSLLLVAVCLLAAGSLYANNETLKDPKKELSQQIDALLDNYEFEVAEDITAVVKFTLNADQEIVVLTVETNDDSLEAYLKGRLNYEKVELENFKEGRTYTVPVRITNS